MSQSLWNEILVHKVMMSEMMKRNVRIAVAALDYLFNLKGQFRAPTLMDERQADVMTLLAVRDGLTRLYNHTTCLQKLASEMNLFVRYGRVFSLLMIDLDDFKAVNDRYGHREGDRLLSVMATLIQIATRETDICCRYGGEEFAVILPSTELPDARQLAERLRLLPIEKLAPERVLTVSIGVASSGPDAQSVQALVDKADSALYMAKHEGKNKVIPAP
jgi:diguanylate cyclase (GGDEF)-like protein